MKDKKRRILDIYQLSKTRVEYRNLTVALQSLEESFIKEQETLNEIEKTLKKIVKKLESRE